MEFGLQHFIPSNLENINISPPLQSCWFLLPEDFRNTVSPQAGTRQLNATGHQTGHGKALLSAFSALMRSDNETLMLD